MRAAMFIHITAYFVPSSRMKLGLPVENCLAGVTPFEFPQQLYIAESYCQWC